MTKQQVKWLKGGLCRQCGERRVESKAYCEEHRTYWNERAKVRYRETHEVRTECDCGAPLVGRERACRACRTAKRQTDARERYQLNLKKRRCIRCGAPGALSKGRRCASCRSYAAEWQSSHVKVERAEEVG
jgi:hypothetical protein